MPGRIDRTKRIGEQIRRELAELLPDVLSQQAHASLLSFTAVRVTRDLSFAKVYVTHVIDNADERKAMIDSLNQHAGQFRFHLAKRLTTRKVPQLTFYYDESVEYGARMEGLLENLVKEIPPSDED